MKQAVVSLSDFFLPRFCPYCKIKLSSAEYIVCENCISNIQLADDERIIFEFNRKFLEDKIINGFASLYVFEKGKELQNLIHALKYEDRFLIGKFLGEKAGQYLSKKITAWRIDLIIPIPLHHLKKAERGYNQSYYIAKGIGKQLAIKVSGNILKRKIYTESQTTMTLKERMANIKDAFSVKREKSVKGKNILLVDDVITTGSTVSECGKTLLASGANKTYAASAAIADF